MNYKRSRLQFYGLIASVVLTAGCASQSLPSNMVSTFRTRITQGGLKHFEVRVLPKAYKEAFEKGAVIGQGEQAQYFSNGERKRVNSDSIAKKSEKWLSHEIKSLLEANQFCREGYWVIDSNYYGMAPHVRGECNDLATEADRNNFPDTIKFW